MKALENTNWEIVLDTKAAYLNEIGCFLANERNRRKNKDFD